MPDPSFLVQGVFLLKEPLQERFVLLLQGLRVLSSRKCRQSSQKGIVLIEVPPLIGDMQVSRILGMHGVVLIP